MQKPALRQGRKGHTYARACFRIGTLLPGF